jgi:hypothetical protein
MKPNGKQEAAMNNMNTTGNLFKLILTLVFVCGGCGGGSKAPRAAYDKAGGFSYDPPQGWRVVEFPGLKYRVSAGPTENGFAPNINVVDEKFSGSLSEYVELNLTTLKKMFVDFKVIKREDFQTDDGVAATRVVCEDTQQGQHLRQTFCFLENSSRKYVVTCSALADGGEKLDALFAQSTKTFRIH